MAEEKTGYPGPPPYPVDVDNQEFAKRLTWLIKCMGKSGRTRICKRTGISSASLGIYMKGKHWPLLPVAVALADALHVSLDWLTGRTNEIGGVRNDNPGCGVYPGHDDPDGGS